MPDAASPKQETTARKRQTEIPSERAICSVGRCDRHPHHGTGRSPAVSVRCCNYTKVVPWCFCADDTSVSRCGEGRWGPMLRPVPLQSSASPQLEDGGLT